MTPRKSVKLSSLASSPAGESLVDWRDPERNTHILDWRERAHEFGLVPVEHHGQVDGLVVEEEEAEAFEEQHIQVDETEAEADRETLEVEEFQEADEARLPHEELDLV